MIAVSDTGPLNYLILLDVPDILDELFEKVLIPVEVAAELKHESAPDSVRSWIQGPPLWLSVSEPKPLTTVVRSVPPLALQAADIACIELAQDHSGCTLLMDDRLAKAEAAARGVIAAGTLALLFRAGEIGLLDFADSLTRLEQTTFRASQTLRAHYRERWRNRPG